jgi:hypothetical protein
MLTLNHKGVDVFIRKFNKKNQESFWNNYTLFIWEKDPSAYSNKKGMFRYNCWGRAEKISIENNGTWKLPRKYVKYFK